jgi:hypothetical protein
MAKIRTEEEWLNCTTPQSLLWTLRGKHLLRQRRLFAVACCWRWLHEMVDPESRRAVEVAERYADALANQDELESVYDAAQNLSTERLLSIPECESDTARLWNFWILAHAAQIACAPSVTFNLTELSRELLLRAAWLGSEHEDQEKRAQCALFRDIFGNPFRPQPSVDSSWLSWNGGVILNLAQAIYDDRAFDRLSILADALEEAGCDNADILNHCRQPGEHVRGCWVVDLLLGKS